jgi:hypothetical protein
MNKCSVQTTVRFSGEKRLITLCSGVFRYVRYSFPSTSNKFCDLSLLHWPLFRAV